MGKKSIREDMAKEIGLGAILEAPRSDWDVYTLEWLTATSYEMEMAMAMSMEKEMDMDTGNKWTGRNPGPNPVMFGNVEHGPRGEGDST
jgi:hypothetical protein